MLGKMGVSGNGRILRRPTGIAVRQWRCLRVGRPPSNKHDMPRGEVRQGRRFIKAWGQKDRAGDSTSPTTSSSGLAQRVYVATAGTSASRFRPDGLPRRVDSIRRRAPCSSGRRHIYVAARSRIDRQKGECGACDRERQGRLAQGFIPDPGASTRSMWIVASASRDEMGTSTRRTSDHGLRNTSR